jgi:hypothetical protein
MCREDRTVDTEEYEGLKITWEYDPDQSWADPREHCNLGTIVCWSRNYDLGDKHSFSDRDEFVRYFVEEPEWGRIERWYEREYEKIPYYPFVKTDDEYKDYHRKVDALDEEHRERLARAARKHAIIIPVYYHEHGPQCEMFIGDEDEDLWNNGAIGYVYVTRKDVLKEYSAKTLTPSVRKKAILVLESEVREYSKWLSGQVYQYTIEDKYGDTIDSCSGLLGWDWAQQAARDAAKWYDEHHPKQLELLEVNR